MSVPLRQDELLISRRQLDTARLREALTPHAELVYGSFGTPLVTQLVDLATQFVAQAPRRNHRSVDAGTVVLITYADSMRRAPEVPLQVLRQTLEEVIGPWITDVHLLPLHPSTSDDGFAVVHYADVDPAVGTWEDVHALGESRGLMLDFVANHLSARAPWFTQWLAGHPDYADLFLPEGAIADVSATTRPRTSPLFHDYPRPDGSVARVWTTFSADQIDLNFAAPSTMLRLTGVLLDYVRHGAHMIRLDAIGFIWKESGTSSMSLPQTHAIVKMWRALLDAVAPDVKLVTETNVPAEENLSYLGQGHDEAHWVYQFPLPPLVLHSFVAQDARHLSSWAATVTPPSPQATFFNFLSSHDGIGLRGSEGILSDADRAALVQRVLDNGGLVSLRSTPDGGSSVYELNTTFTDALPDPSELTDAAVVSAKALAAHAILMSVVGVPGIYIQSLVGARNDPEAARESGINRRISRTPLQADEVAQSTAQEGLHRAILDGLARMATVRASLPHFDPYTPHHVEFLESRIFAVRRVTPGSDTSVLCLINVSPDVVPIPQAGWDLLTETHRDQGALGPYEYVWLQQDS